MKKYRAYRVEELLGLYQEKVSLGGGGGGVEFNLTEGEHIEPPSHGI